jgi:hypothetical protein
VNTKKYYLNALAADENTTDKITNSLSVFNIVCKSSVIEKLSICFGSLRGV